MVSLQKAALIPGGSDSLVYTTLSGWLKFRLYQSCILPLYLTTHCDQDSVQVFLSHSTNNWYGLKVKVSYS